MMDRKKSLETLCVLSAGLLALWLLLRLDGFVYGSLALLACGIFIPPAGDSIARVWLKLSRFLGWITSKALLTIVYYFLLFPLAFLSKRFTGDKLNLRRKNLPLFLARNHTYNKNDFEKPW